MASYEVGDSLALTPPARQLGSTSDMQTERPHLFVVDDDRAVLTLVGTNVSCLDVLRALRSMSPQCEAVLTTGYESVEAAVDAFEAEPGRTRRRCAVARPSSTPTVPASLVDVERDHIVRTLEQVRGNKAVAARLLGVSRRAFYRQLERHGLHQRIRRAPCGVGRSDHHDDCCRPCVHAPPAPRPRRRRHGQRFVRSSRSC